MSKELLKWVWYQLLKEKEVTWERDKYTNPKLVKFIDEVEELLKISK